MNRSCLLLAGASLSAMSLAAPAIAQTVPTPPANDGKIQTGAGASDQAGDAPSGTTQAAAQGDGTDIVVTAQRRAEALQSVPISVSAFNADALQKQQISNATDLQLSLPNVTFTKTNFTSSSFTIRGIGDLCVGFSCDRATGIHFNDMPLVENRLFETEYFDLERVEVLRGPQGTLYGRNATSGVVNFITARPKIGEWSGNATAEFGNYESRKFTGALNVPVTDFAALRLAGYSLTRGGYTKNLFDGSKIDGRDLYALRGTLRLRPTSGTTVDLIGYIFREDDDRSRIQKQLCARDNTGILGCRPDRLENGTVNANATLAGILTSRQFFTLNSPVLAPLALSDLNGPDTFFGNAINPADLRTVNTDFNPTYKAKETILQARIEQELGQQFSLTLTGGYAKSLVDSRTDYSLTAGSSLANNPGLVNLATLPSLPGAFFPQTGGVNPYQFFTPVAQRFIPNGPAGAACISEPNPQFSGIYGGNVAQCTAAGGEFDRSNSHYRQYSLEGHVDSNFDGPLNFIVGGIYTDGRFTDSNYYVVSSGLDYAAGILGAATTLAQRLGGNATFPQVYLAPPFYDSQVTDFRLKSSGIFGDATFEVSDKFKISGGLRWSHDAKRQVARAPLLKFPAIVGVADANTSPFLAAYDADPAVAGSQVFAIGKVSFSRLTGRLVLDYQLTRNNLVYASYSRGYKAGGLNPPIDPTFNISPTFAPEAINAFEVGTKNTLFGGVLRLNASAFYYDYKGLQLSRIVARTSVNDNTDAQIYGVEVEGVLRPTNDLLLNFSGSYLKSKIKGLSLVDPRDPSGGRADAVIIKNLTDGSNCAVVPTTTLPAGAAAGLVGAFNAGVNAATGNNLAAPVPVPGTNATGAYSICYGAGSLSDTIANPPAALRAAFGVATGPLPFTVTEGVAINVNGNELPQSPNWKFSAGAQYTARLGRWTLVPRADIAYTGRYYARSFNNPIDRIDAFTVINAQVQLNAPGDRWNVRAFVQNLTNSDAVTGLYTGDQSSGIYTNVFTLEPRRYGVSVGVKF
ncbi:TonB-dependent receptor [Sphingomonas rosea]|uniref:TonB-dependent receptor n=1 Tax=Sphingomonas rosea TaxID=335605 RepID=A0ABP7UHN4_9SPHN